MKQCPTCKMTVDAEHECPICGTSLFYEDKVDEYCEKIIYNKYFWLYLAKVAWFSVACLVFCGIRGFSVRAGFSGLWLSAMCLCLISLLLALFGRSLSKLFQWKYTEDYSVFWVSLWKYLLGGIAVFISLFI